MEVLPGKTPHRLFEEQEEEGHAILLDRQLGVGVGGAQESMKTHS